MLGGCMKHKWFGFVIALVICLSSVLVAVGAFSLFSKKTSQTTTAPIVNTPVNSGIYISADSFLQNTATQNQDNLKIQYQIKPEGDESYGPFKVYDGRFSVSFHDSVKFTITSTNGYYIQSITTGAVDETLTQFVADSSIKTSNMRSYMLNKSTNDTNTVTEIECQYADTEATYKAIYYINNIEKSQHFSAESAQHVWSLTIPQSDAFLVSLISVNNKPNTSTNANGSITIPNITYSSVVKFKVEATKIADPSYTNIYKYKLTACAWGDSVYPTDDNFIKDKVISIEEEGGAEHAVQYGEIYNKVGFFRGNNTLNVKTEQLVTNISIPNFNTLSNYVNFYIQIKNEDGSVAKNWQTATTGKFQIFVGQTFTLKFSPKYKSQGNGYYISSMEITRNNQHTKTYTNTAFKNGLSTSWIGFINEQDSFLNYVTENGTAVNYTTPSAISVRENVLHAQKVTDPQMATLTIYGLYGTVALNITCNQYMAFAVAGGLSNVSSMRPELKLGWEFENLKYIPNNGDPYFQYTPTNKQFSILYHASNTQFILQVPLDTQTVNTGNFSAIDPFLFKTSNTVSYPNLNMQANQGCSYLQYTIGFSAYYTITIQYTYPSNGVGDGEYDDPCYIGQKLTNIQIVLTETIITNGYKLTLSADPNYDVTVYFSEKQVHGGKPAETDIISAYTTYITGGTQAVVSLTITKNLYLYVEYTPKAYEISFETPQTGSSTIQNMPTTQTWYYRGFIQQTTGFLPQANGYTFMGFYTQPNGKGIQIINANGEIVSPNGNNGFLSDYTFDGEKSNVYYVGEQNLTLYAYWQVKNVQFTYQMATVGTSTIQVQIPSFATSITNPRGFILPYDTVLNGQTLTALATGYTYLGMYVILQGQEYALTDAQGNFLLVEGITKQYEEEIVLAPTNVDTSIQIIAYWQANPYTISFEISGIGSDRYENSQTNIVITYDIALQTKVNVPTTIGYTFTGWYYGDEQIYDANGNLVASNSLLSSGNWHHADNVTLTSKWVEKELTLSFSMNHTGLKDAHTFKVDTTSVKLKYNTSYTLPTALSAGYNFLGWLMGAQTYQAGQTIVINATTLGEEWFMQNKTSAVAQWRIKTFQAPNIENLEYGSITFNKQEYEYGESVIITFTPNAFYYVNQGLTIQGVTIATTSAWNENLSANITFAQTTNVNNAENQTYHASNAIVEQSSNTYTKIITINYLLEEITVENEHGFFAQQTYQVQVIDAYNQSAQAKEQLALYTQEFAQSLYSIPDSIPVPSHYRLEFIGWVIQSTNTGFYYNFVDNEFNLPELTENAYAKDFTDLQQIVFTLSTNVVISATYEIALKQSAVFYYYSAQDQAYVQHEEQFSFDEHNCVYINYYVEKNSVGYVVVVNGVATETSISIDEVEINLQTNIIKYQNQTFEAYFEADSQGVQRFDLVTDLTVDLPVESTSFLPDASLTWAGWVYFKEPQTFETYLLLTEDGVMCGDVPIEAHWFTNETNVDDQYYVYQVYKQKGV